MDTRRKIEHFIRILMVLTIFGIRDIQCMDGVKFFTWWNTLSRAVDEFAHEYQLQHGTSIQVIRQFKQADEIVNPAKRDDSTGMALLEFSYPRGNQQVQASVIVEIPELGANYMTGATMLQYIREKYMYQVILPLMYQSWPYEKLSPNFYASKESEILIIENLHDSSYIIKDSLLNSVAECKLVFKSLARFHALSIARLNDDEYSKLRALILPEIYRSFGVASTFAIEYLTSYVHKILSLPIPFEMKEQIRIVHENIDSIYTLMYTPRENFNVLLHGALKRKTVYFKFDSESRALTGCKFVDFRASFVGSPVVDLMSYLINSVEFEVFKMHRDSLFRFYLEELHKTFAELKRYLRYFPRYNLVDLHEDLRLYKPYFIQTLVYQVPVFWADGIPSNTDEIVETYNSALQSNKYLSFLENWMQIFLIG